MTTDVGVPHAVEIHVTMPDGSVWAVDGHISAHARATYYANVDSDTTYQEEYDFTIGDDYELVDWAVGNMNWDDFEKTARLVKPASFNPQDGWMSGKKVVVRTHP